MAGIVPYVKNVIREEKVVTLSTLSQGDTFRLASVPYETACEEKAFFLISGDPSPQQGRVFVVGPNGLTQRLDSIHYVVLHKDANWAIGPAHIDREEYLVHGPQSRKSRRGPLSK